MKQQLHQRARMISSREFSEIDWNTLQLEIASVPSLLSSSLDLSNPDMGFELLKNVRESIIHSTYFLLHGHLFPRDATYDKIPCPFAVWPSLHCARSNIFSQLFPKTPTSTMSGPRVFPTVIVVTDSLLYCNTPREPMSQFSRRNHEDYCIDSLPDDPFLSSWAHICKDRSQMFTVVSQSSSQVCSKIEAILESSVLEGTVCSALVVLHISCDSFISSDLTTLREVCNARNAFLCVEGAGLALLAQENVPRDPKCCWNAADVLIIDSASWFGFDDCAVVSVQRTENHYNESKPSFSIPVSVPNSQNYLPHALISHLKLWTLISRIGPGTMRLMISRTTALAESFIHFLKTSANIEANSEGVAGVVRITYALSRDDRLLSLERGRQLASGVNDAIFTSLEDRAAILGVLKGNGEHGIFMHFSPIRLLSLEKSLNISDIRDFTRALQDAADRYETCRVGSAAFISRVSLCDNLEVIDEEDRTVDLSLSFGGFRVIPNGKGHVWRNSEEDIKLVAKLTFALATELSYNTEYGTSESLATNVEILEQASHPGKWNEDENVILHSFPAQKGTKIESKKSNEYSKSLPILFYFHSKVENDVPNFISVEPKTPSTPVSAVHQAYFAAELVIYSAQAVIEKWSGELSIEIPRSTNSMNHFSVAHADIEWEVKNEYKTINTHSRSSPSEEDSMAINMPAIQGVTESFSEDDFVSARSGGEDTGVGSTNQAWCSGRLGISQDVFEDESPSESSGNFAGHCSRKAFSNAIAIGDYGPLDTEEESSAYSGSYQNEMSEIMTEKSKKGIGRIRSLPASETSKEMISQATSKVMGWFRFWRSKRIQTYDVSITRTSLHNGEKRNGEKTSSFLNDTGSNRIINDNEDNSKSENQKESLAFKFLEAESFVDESEDYESDSLELENSEIEQSQTTHTEEGPTESESKIRRKYRELHANRRSVQSDSSDTIKSQNFTYSSQTKSTESTSLNSLTSASTEKHSMVDTGSEVGATSKNPVRHPNRSEMSFLNWLTDSNKERIKAASRSSVQNTLNAINQDDSCQEMPKIAKEETKSKIVDHQQQNCRHIQRLNKQKRSGQSSLSQEKTQTEIGVKNEKCNTLHSVVSNNTRSKSHEHPISTEKDVITTEPRWGTKSVFRWFRRQIENDDQAYAPETGKTTSPMQSCITSLTRDSSYTSSHESTYVCSKTTFCSRDETMNKLENIYSSKDTETVSSNLANSFSQTEESHTDETIPGEKATEFEQELSRRNVLRNGIAHSKSISVTSRNRSATTDHGFVESDSDYCNNSQLEDQDTSRTLSSGSQLQIVEDSSHNSESEGATGLGSELDSGSRGSSTERENEVDRASGYNSNSCETPSITSETGSSTWSDEMSELLAMQERSNEEISSSDGKTPVGRYRYSKISPRQAFSSSSANKSTLHVTKYSTKKMSESRELRMIGHKSHRGNPRKILDPQRNGSKANNEHRVIRQRSVERVPRTAETARRLSCIMDDLDCYSDSESTSDVASETTDDVTSRTTSGLCDTINELSSSDDSWSLSHQISQEQIKDGLKRNSRRTMRTKQRVALDANTPPGITREDNREVNIMGFASGITSYFSWIPSWKITKINDS